MEVLISMAILSIGLMGMLALLPMGLLQMRDAVISERTTQTASIMEGHARILWRSAWLNAAGVKDELTVLQNNPELLALDNPRPAVYSNNPLVIAAEVNNPASVYNTQRMLSAASSPVYLDPIGFAVQLGASQTTVAGLFTPGPNGVSVLPRRSVTISPYPPATALPTAVRIRMCSLMDDLTFDMTGLPTNPLQRAGDYNAAWLIQRAKNNVRTEVNLQVVVYRKRPPADTASPENLISSLGMNAMSPGTKEMTVNLGGAIPTPKVGTWIIVANAQTQNAGGIPIADAYADFYRIVAVSGTGTLTFEVNVPIRDRNFGSAYSGYIIQMDNVAEVFDKGTLTLYKKPTQ